MPKVYVSQQQIEEFFGIEGNRERASPVWTAMVLVGQEMIDNFKEDLCEPNLNLEKTQLIRGQAQSLTVFLNSLEDILKAMSEETIDNQEESENE